MPLERRAAAHARLMYTIKHGYTLMLQIHRGHVEVGGILCFNKIPELKLVNVTLFFFSWVRLRPLFFITQPCLSD